MILSGVASLLLLFILNAMRSVKIVSSVALFRVAVVFILGFAISFPVGDLSQAMVIAREERGKVSPIKLIENTIQIFNDKPKLE
jgi:hypothetical protein